MLNAEMENPVLRPEPYLIISLLARNEQHKGFVGNPDFGAFSLLQNAVDCGIINQSEANEIIRDEKIPTPEVF